MQYNFIHKVPHVYMHVYMALRSPNTSVVCAPCTPVMHLSCHMCTYPYMNTRASLCLQNNYHMSKCIHYANTLHAGMLWACPFYIPQPSYRGSRSHGCDVSAQILDTLHSDYNSD